MNVAIKIKSIREMVNLSQGKLAELTGSSVISIQNYENNRRVPNYKFIQKLCNQFPEYALWLISDNVDVEQISNKKLAVKKCNS